MRTKYILAIALFALMMLGGAVSAEGAPTEETGLLVDFGVTPLAAGCENFCGHCLIINGDGACSISGSCC